MFDGFGGKKQRGTYKRNGKWITGVQGMAGSDGEKYSDHLGLRLFRISSMCGYHPMHVRVPSTTEYKVRLC